MGNKMVGIYKKRQNLILGLLIALFWITLFAQTISITDTYPDAAVKDFAIMRPVSVPTQGDVKTALGLVEKEIGDAYSFDHLYNNVYALFVFGIIALFMCFKKFNNGLLSKLVAFGYSGFALYSVMFSTNMGHILKTHDTGYAVKVVIAVLMFLVSLIGIIFIIRDLSKNNWLKYVNVHIFLNSICSILILATTALMFVPFEFEGKTASVMGYLLLPNNSDATGFAAAFERTIADFNINSVIMIPLVFFVIGVLASVFGAGYHKNVVSPVMSIVWAVLCIVGCFASSIMAIDSKMVVYIVLSVATIAVAVVNLIQHHKANAIYR